MPARQNIVIVIPRGWAEVRSLLAPLQAVIEEWIGSPRLLSIQDVVTGSTDDRQIVGAFTGDDLPEASENEIVAVYPDDRSRGAVLAMHEGSFDLIVISTDEHGLAGDRSERIWSLIGGEAQAVLVGEELEVEHNQIVELLRSGQLPADLDLCEAAILRDPQSRPAVLRQELPYGGRLLLREDRSPDA